MKWPCSGLFRCCFSILALAWQCVIVGSYKLEFHRMLRFIILYFFINFLTVEVDNLKFNAELRSWMYALVEV